MLQPAASEDTVELHRVFTKPGVRRFIFDDQVISPERTSAIVQKNTELFAERGFGLWLARVRAEPSRQAGDDSVATGRPILGFGGFWFFRDPPELELLYGVVDDQVKKGYGREIVRAVIDYGFDTLKMPAIRASTDPTHLDSRRLLEEFGFVFERQEIAGGLDTVFYEVPRPTTR